MLNFLSPTRLKLIIAFLIAALTFVASELVVASKDRIWASVHPVITREVLTDIASSEESVTFESAGREIIPVTRVERDDIERALWKESTIKLLIFLVTGYLGSCLIVGIARASNEI